MNEKRPSKLIGHTEKRLSEHHQRQNKKTYLKSFFLQISYVPILVYFIVLTYARKHTYLLLSEGRCAEELNSLPGLVSLYVWTWEIIDGKPTGLEWKHFVCSFISPLIHLEDRYWLCSLGYP